MGSKERALLLSCEVRSLLGYRIIPELETPSEITGASQINESSSVLTVGGASTPFYFLERARYVEVIDLNPGQIDHLNLVRHSISQNGPPSLDQKLIELVARPLAWGPSEVESLKSEIRGSYEFIFDPQRALTLRDKLGRIDFREGDILELESRTTPSIVYISTLPNVWGRLPETFDKFLDFMLRFLDAGIPVVYTEINVNRFSMANKIVAAGLQHYGKIQRTFSSKCPYITYCVFSAN